MDMPDGTAAALATAGALMIFTGLIGGGVKVKDVEVPRVSPVLRTALVLIGVGMIAVTIAPLSGQGAEASTSADRGSGHEVTVDPPLSNVGDDSDEEPADTTALAVPSLVGLSLEGADRSLADAGLRVGQRSTRTAWRPSGEVLEQSPVPGATCEEGATVDLVVADSEHTFRSVRTLVSEAGKVTRAQGEYRVRLARSEDGGVVGDFELVEASLSGIGEEERAFIDALRGSHIYASPDSLEELDLGLAWSAYSQRLSDLGIDLATSQNDVDAAMPHLGVAFLALMIAPQVAFDMRAIFWTMPSGTAALELQAAGGVASSESGTLASIRVEGPSATAGPNRVFTVVRKGRDDAAYQRVGTASYSIDSGVLQRLDIAMDRSGGTYRLEIWRP